MSEATSSWRTHPLMVDEAVKRWMTSRRLTDGYRLRSLRALGRYCAYRQMSPTELIDEAVEAAGNKDPRVRLRPKDMLNQWKRSLGIEYGSVTLVRQILPFYDENGCHVEMLVQAPKSPARQNRIRVDPDLTRRILRITPEPEYRWGVIGLAESGMRPNSFVNLEWHNVTYMRGGPLDGLLQIQVPGQITKTGQPYWCFALEDAANALQSLVPRVNPSQRSRIINYSAQGLEHYVDRKLQELEINPKKGLRPFTCTAFRSHVQEALEGAGVPPNRVSLLMGAQPHGRDKHYANPPPEVLGEEYLKARKELQIFR